jgi:penicillin-insensitive murein DD-endopeptidase
MSAFPHLYSSIFGTALISVSVLVAQSAFGSTKANPESSQCYGTVSNGRIERAVQLPASGPNFTSYSNAGVIAGRTYVHSKVAAVINSSYKELQKQIPDVLYVYGETGWAEGGRLRPHRTHQNGLSVDFFVPVRDRQGKSVAHPSSIVNRYGYDIVFDANGTYGEGDDALRIDFEATATHLYYLREAARQHGVGISLVIFEPAYLPKLFATKHGATLKSLPFMRGKPWARHDEHYHVDFAVPCKPMVKK